MNWRPRRQDWIRGSALIALATVAGLLWHQRYRESLPPHDIKSLMAAEDISGAVLALQHADTSTRVLTYGRSVRASSPLDAAARLPIASLSKPLTASAVRQLVRRGRLGLQDAAITWLPELRQGADPRLAHITVSHLLQHTSGLGGPGDPLFDGARVAGCARAIEVVVRHPLDSDPGKRMRYSNVGYCLRGRLSERVTGQGYAAAVTDLLELPDPSALTLGPPTSPHQGHGLAADDWQSIGAAGGWFSDARTLAAIFSADARDRSIAAPPVDGHLGLSNYGLGWRVWPSSDAYKLTHFGTMRGMLSLGVAYPGGCSAVILMNGRPRDSAAYVARLTPFVSRELRHIPDTTVGWRERQLSH